MDQPKPLRIGNEVLTVEGLHMVLHWPSWERGMSVFVPCIDADAVRRQMTKLASKYRYKLASQERVESQQFGVRFWRIA